jgi:hypothetical protein
MRPLEEAGSGIGRYKNPEHKSTMNHVHVDLKLITVSHVPEDLNID